MSEPTTTIPAPTPAAPSAPAPSAAPAAPTPASAPAAPAGHPFSSESLRSRAAALGLNLGAPTSSQAAAAEGAVAAAPVDPAAVAPPITDGSDPGDEIDDGRGAADDGGAAAAADDDPAAPAADDAPALTVKLPSRLPNGEPLEIEVSDPEVAEHLRMLANGYSRTQEHARRMEQVQAREGVLRQKEAELVEIETAMAVNPVGFVADHLPAQRQQELALLLVAQHFEALAPEIEQMWEGEAHRERRLRQFVEARRAGEQTMQQQMTVQRWAADVRAAVQALIPAEAADADKADFADDALAYLARIADQRQFRADDVPSLLETRVRRYFGAVTPAGNKPTATAGPTRATTRASAAHETPEAKQQRLARAARSRAAARAVAPQGAVAPAAALPRPPKDAGIAATAQFARQMVNQGIPRSS